MPSGNGKCHCYQGVDKGPVNIVEDDLNRVVRVKFERGFVSGKGEMVSCPNKRPPAIWLILQCSSWGEKRKGGLGGPHYEVKNWAFR